MKYGTHNAMQSTIAITTAVEIPIAQLLPMLLIFDASCGPGELVLARQVSAAVSTPKRLGEGDGSNRDCLDADKG
jgi:hypothetical protein